MFKVVVPTDFSDNAYNALRYACQILKYERSEIFLLHAYADEVYNQDELVKRSFFNELKEACFQRSEHSLEDILARIVEYSPNPRHEFKTISVFGTLTDEVNDLVNNENIDLVIMGTRGATNDKNITFGSHTLQLLKYVQCPVLAIPEGYSFKPPREVLFPTDFGLPYKRRELKLLSEMAKAYKSKIHLLHIDPCARITFRQEDNRLFLTECLKKAELQYETTKEKDKTDAISEYIGKHQIDMLVMVNSRHSHLEDMLYRSTIDRLGLHIKIPFLVLQNLSR